MCKPFLAKSQGRWPDWIYRPQLAARCLRAVPPGAVTSSSAWPWSTLWLVRTETGCKCQLYIVQRISTEKECEISHSIFYFRYMLK